MVRHQIKRVSYKALLARQFPRLLPLQVLLLAISAVNGVISSYYGSNFVNMEAMIAIGLFMPISMFVTAAGNMLMGGSQILAGRLIGENQLLRSRRIFTSGFIAAGVLSVTLSALLLICAFTGRTDLFTGSRLVQDALSRYMIGQAIGIPPLMLGQQLSAFQSLDTRQRHPEIASIACVLANLFFCELLVRRLQKGVLGLSLASALGSLVFFLILFWYYLVGRSARSRDRVLQDQSMESNPARSRSTESTPIQGRSTEHGTLPRFATLKEIGAIIWIGLPGALHNIFEMLRTMVVNALIVKYVTDIGLSSQTAVNSVMRIFWAIPFGMLAVSRVLIGISIGEEDRKDLTDIMRNAIFRCMPIMFVIAVVLILCADPLTRLFFKDPAQDVYQMTRMGFRLLPLCLPLAVFSHHFACFAQASRQHFLEYVNPFFAGFAFVSLFSAILISRYGMTGMYIANILNSSLCCLIVLLYSCVKRKSFPRNLEHLMVLDDSFGAKEEERLDITVRSLDEVVNVSRKTFDFCKERGIDDRRAFFCSLFLEEMAGNVVIHGFRDGKKQYYVEIRVVHKEDNLFLRIKDNCSPFNPKSFTDILLPKDPTAGIGIRLVFHLAREVQYQSILGLNVLTMYLPERSENGIDGDQGK